MTGRINRAMDMTLFKLREAANRPIKQAFSAACLSLDSMEAINADVSTF